MNLLLLLLSRIVCAQCDPVPPIIAGTETDFSVPYGNILSVTWNAGGGNIITIDAKNTHLVASFQYASTYTVSAVCRYSGGVEGPQLIEFCWPVPVRNPLNAGQIGVIAMPQKHDVALLTDVVQSVSTASGGYTDTYTYQWQQSADGNNWDDIKGQTDAAIHGDLYFTGKIYYRRKVVNNYEPG